MERPSKITKEDALKILETFTDDIESMMLSTVDENGKPFASYAPFVEDENGHYYICVSGYVPHSKNMNATKKAAIMFIEDEQNAAHPFGRKRLYFDADVEMFSENDERKEKIAKLFEEKFNGKVSFMLSMPDFRIYKFTPKNGSIVLGFGAAFHVSDDKKSLKFKNALHEKKHDDTLKEKTELI